MRNFIDAVLNEAAIPDNVVRHTYEELQPLDIDDLDRMAYGVAGGDIVEIDPNVLTIKWHMDLENPEYKFKLSGMKWVRSVSFEEPIEISIAQDGTIHLEDGHHRVFCAKKLGRTLTAEVEVKGNPIKRILELEEEGKPLNPTFPGRIIEQNDE